MLAENKTATNTAKTTKIETKRFITQALPKIGIVYAKKLKKFGIKTVHDLLFYFPARYDDFSEIISIKAARQKLGETVCVQGQIVEIENKNTFKKFMSMTEATIQDDGEEIKVIWLLAEFIII